MIEFIKKLDVAILLWLNGSHSPFWDKIMWFASGKFTWIPFYIVLILLVVWKFKKLAIPMLFLVIPLIGLSDFIASGIFKTTVERLRPSHEPSLQNMLHIVNNYSGGPFGFMSSHAANVFALAFYLSFVTYKKIKWLPYILIPWAIFVSISRIYLGVHYPTDIIVPLLINIPFALLFKQLYKFITIKYYVPKNKLQ